MNGILQLVFVKPALMLVAFVVAVLVHQVAGVGPVGSLLIAGVAVGAAFVAASTLRALCGARRRREHQR